MTEQNTEGFYAAQTAFGEGRLTENQWQAYQILWHSTTPLPNKAVNEAGAGYWGARKRPLWAAQLTALAKMGLVAETPDGWAVTAATNLTPLEPPAKKPSAKKFAKGVEDLELAMVRASNVGLATKEAEAVLEWLKSKVK